MPFDNKLRNKHDVLRAVYFSNKNQIYYMQDEESHIMTT